MAKWNAGCSIWYGPSCNVYIYTQFDTIYRLGVDVVCDDATEQSLILAGFCMSYNSSINDTVIRAQIPELSS